MSSEEGRRPPPARLSACATVRVTPRAPRRRPRFHESFCHQEHHHARASGRQQDRVRRRHGRARTPSLASSAARERAALARGKHGGDGSAQARRQARRGVAGPPPTLPRMAYSERLRVLGGHITGASCSGTSEPAAQTVGLLKCLLRPAIRLRFERSVSYWGRGLYAYHVLA